MKNTKLSLYQWFTELSVKFHGTVLSVYQTSTTIVTKKYVKLAFFWSDEHLDYYRHLATWAIQKANLEVQSRFPRKIWGTERVTRIGETSWSQKWHHDRENCRRTQKCFIFFTLFYDSRFFSLVSPLYTSDWNTLRTRRVIHRAEEFSPLENVSHSTCRTSFFVLQPFFYLSRTSLSVLFLYFATDKCSSSALVLVVSTHFNPPAENGDKTCLSNYFYIYESTYARNTTRHLRFFPIFALNRPILMSYSTSPLTSVYYCNPLSTLHHPSSIIFYLSLNTVCHRSLYVCIYSLSVFSLSMKQDNEHCCNQIVKLRDKRIFNAPFFSSSSTHLEVGEK